MHSIACKIFTRTYKEVARLSLLGLVLTSCSANSQKVAQKSVLQVNEHKMSLREFSESLARELRELDSLSAKDSASIEKAKEKIVREFTLQSLILDFAKSKDIEVSEDDLDKEVNKVRGSYPDDLSFRKELANKNLSFQFWRENIRLRLIEKKVFAKLSENSKNISEDELKTYYESRKEFFKHKERVLLRQILLNDEAKADFLKEELLKRKSFEDFAKRYSIAPEAKEGGLMGWVERGSLDFVEIVFSKPTEALYGPIRSPYGFHIMKVEKRSPSGVPTFSELRGVLMKELLARKEQASFTSWLDSQLRSAKVLKDTQLINSLKIETRSD